MDAKSYGPEEREMSIELDIRIAKAQSFLHKCGYKVIKEKQYASQFSLEGLAACGGLIGICFGTLLNYATTMPNYSATRLISTLFVVGLVAIASMIIIRDDEWKMDEDD